MRYLLTSILLFASALLVSAQMENMRRGTVEFPGKANVKSDGKTDIKPDIKPDTKLDFKSGGNVDVFIRIDGFRGDATYANSPNWKAVQSFSLATFGPKNPGNTLTFTKQVDAESALLLDDNITGRHIQEAILAVRRRSDGIEMIRITLRDVLVQSVRLESGGGGSFPTDEISFGFSGLTVEITDKSGKRTAEQR